jgi:hypothetical protein
VKCWRTDDRRRTKSKKGGWHFKKIFSSETAEPISTKLYWNDPWVVPFQNCVRHFRPSTKMDRDKMSTLYREPSIDASYQVSVHMAEGFQRRRLKCEKLTNDRQQTTDDGRQVILWMAHFQNYVQQPHFLSTFDVKLKTRWAVTGSWEPLVKR